MFGSANISQAAPIQNSLKQPNVQALISSCRKSNSISNSSSADKKQDNSTPLPQHTHTLHPSWIPAAAAISTCLEWIITVTIHLLSRHRDTPPAAIHSYTMRKWDGTEMRHERDTQAFVTARYVSSDEFSWIVSSGLSRFSFILNAVHAPCNYGLFGSV